MEELLKLQAHQLKKQFFLGVLRYCPYALWFIITSFKFIPLN
jgi:hypothetical protein